MRDTNPQAWASYHRLIDSMSGADRLAQAARLSDGIRTLAVAGLRRRHPLAGEEELRWRLMALCYGKRFAEQVLGGRPGASD